MNVRSKIELPVELQPFTVPNYVIQVMPAQPREAGLKEAPKYKLSDIDAATLSVLCDEFRAEVFRTSASKEQISEAVGYSITSSTFANSLSELRVAQLIEGRNTEPLIASATLFEE